MVITKNVYELHNGQTIPQIGFGTWEIKPENTAASVKAALSNGYRLIDTAKIYGNEKEVGEGVRASGIPREDIFITTKLWNEDQGYETTRAAFNESLQKLDMDFLDLYLIHWPATSRRGTSWKAMIDLYKERKVKAIGVSNFTIRHLQELHDHYDVVPMVNQVEFHPFIYEQQRELLLYCHDNHIVVEAYSPLSRISKSGNPVAERIAEKHHVSVAQVFLRWCLQHRTVPLPRSVNPEHIKDNLNVFDFELDEDDIDKLNRLSDGERVTWDPADMH